MPLFPAGDEYWCHHHQTTFCHYTLRDVSAATEVIFGRSCYFFGTLPPQHNCPSTRVSVRDKFNQHLQAVFHCCLHYSRRSSFAGSRIHSVQMPIKQVQTAVKLYGVFFYRLVSLDCSPARSNFAPPILGTVTNSLIRSSTSELTRQGIWLP